MPKNTSHLLAALKKKQLHEAQVIFKQIMQGKAVSLIEREQRSLNEEVPAQPETLPPAKKEVADSQKTDEDLEELPADDMSESFKSVQKKIEGEGYSKKTAGAILAKKTREASASAKKKNPKLKKVRG